MSARYVRFVDKQKSPTTDLCEPLRSQWTFERSDSEYERKKIKEGHYPWQPVVSAV